MSKKNKQQRPQGVLGFGVASSDADISAIGLNNEPGSFSVSEVEESTPSEDISKTDFEPFVVHTTPGSLNVREEPLRDANVLFQIPRHTSLKVLGVHGDWYYIETVSLPIRKGCILSSFAVKG